VAQAEWGGQATAHIVGFTISACSLVRLTPTTAALYGNRRPYPPDTPPTCSKTTFVYAWEAGDPTLMACRLSAVWARRPGNSGWVGSRKSMHCVHQRVAT